MDYVAKGLAKEVFSTKHVAQRFLISRQKGSGRCGESSGCRLGMIPSLSDEVKGLAKGLISIKFLDGF